MSNRDREYYIGKVRECLEALLSVCDGAHSRDGAGFNSGDSGFARSLYSQVCDRQFLTDRQGSAAIRMLRKYDGQLSAMDLSFNYEEGLKVFFPLDDRSIWTASKADQKTIKAKFDEFVGDFEAYTKSLEWSSDIVWVDYERKRVWKTPLDKKFWDFWSNYKDVIRENGYRPSKYKGQWELTYWEDFPINKGFRRTQYKLPPFTKSRLLAYQRGHFVDLVRAFKFCGSVVDCSDTGTGKTYTAVALANYLGLKPVVVTPRAVVSSFDEVIHDHFGIDGFVSNYEQYKSENTKYLRVFEEEVEGKPEWRCKWQNMEKCLLIIDEAHRCKNHGTQNTEMLIQAAKQGIPVLAMSATLAENPLDLGAVGRAVGIFKTQKEFFSWLKQFCFKGRWGGWEFKATPEKLEALRGMIFPARGARMRVSELGDAFPDTLIVPQKVSLKSASEIQKYHNETMQSVKNLEGKEYKRTVLTYLNRSRQFAELKKVPAFVEMAQDGLDNGHSVCIFVNFNETVELLRKDLKTDCLVTGRLSSSQVTKNIEDFQSGKSRVIILNSAAGGTGVSLHDTLGGRPRLSLISPSWDARIIKQVFGRVHRAGGKTKSIQKIVFAAETYEEVVYKVFKAKVNNIDQLNDGDLEQAYLSENS